MHSSKASGLPKNWPKSSKKDLEQLPYRIVNIGTAQSFHFKSNFIKTSKYEWWNFFPKFLFEEFNPYLKFANCYFLIIAGLQVVPAITNTNSMPTVLIPLIGVLTIAGVLKAFEDMERHRADTDANSSVAEVFDHNLNKFRKKHWSLIQVGDFVRVKSREVVPADMVIFQVWEPNPESPKGSCYVETKSLDGETNLKYRTLIPALVGNIKSNDDLLHFKGRIEMEHPNCLLDTFTGVLETSELGRLPIFPNNLVLRGCVLRSTEFIVGLVVNTGHDVKIMQTKMETKVKSSNLEYLATKQIVKVIFLLIFICLVGSIGEVIFNNHWDLDSVWYIQWDRKPGATFIIQFFYLMLLHASFVPVALYVSMAVVRFTQSKFMRNDLEMYYEKLDSPALVRTMTLNEELGQISHIFSDKTGTLTCNVMNFRKASINGVSYGKGITEIGKASWKLMGKPVPPEVLADEKMAVENSVPHVSFYCPEFESDFHLLLDEQSLDNYSSATNRDSPKALQRQKIKDFYRYLSVCHEVIPERLETGGIKLSAPNPDDEALVCAASYFGFEYRDRRDKFFIVHEKETDKLLDIEVLYTIPFSSSRKRMSVIIRDIDNKIKVICKGADSMIFSRCITTDETLIDLTKQHVDQFSIEGMRCLVIAVKEIDEETFKEWSKHYDRANIDFAELEKRKNGLENDLDILESKIEDNLRVIGATAIEDRLQDGVVECIDNLTKAGIKTWMLTGDKEETAINIAVACNLVLPPEYMEQILINAHTAPEASKATSLLKKQLMKYFIDNGSTKFNESHSEGNHDDSNFDHIINLEDIPPLKSDSKPRSLIIDGPSLILIMNDEKAKKLFLLFSMCCQSVVCCRVSPDQKRSIVDLVKLNVPGVRTLAIGDGANDVAMITAAHVGVGIKGEEGLQAVNASDYAIGQFRFLQFLILKHGRYNYLRMSNLICFMFYKNIFMSMTMFWYNFFNGYSGLKFYTEAAIQFYNLFYTAFPILLHSTYDCDLLASTVFTYPELFKSCISNQYFSNSIFWSWVVTAIGESVLLSVFFLYLLTNFDFQTGALESYMEVGGICFFAVVIVVNLKLFSFQNNWYLINIVVILLSIGSWIAIGTIANYLILVDFDFYTVWTRLLTSGVFWLATLLIVGTVCVKDLLVASIDRYFFYKPYHILQEMEFSSKLLIPDSDIGVELGKTQIETL